MINIIIITEFMTLTLDPSTLDFFITILLATALLSEITLDDYYFGYCC